MYIYFLNVITILPRTIILSKPERIMETHIWLLVEILHLRKKMINNKMILETNRSWISLKIKTTIMHINPNIRDKCSNAVRSYLYLRRTRLTEDLIFSSFESFKYPTCPLLLSVWEQQHRVFNVVFECNFSKSDLNNHSRFMCQNNLTI